MSQNSTTYLGQVYIISGLTSDPACWREWMKKGWEQSWWRWTNRGEKRGSFLPPTFFLLVGRARGKDGAGMIRKEGELLSLALISTSPSSSSSVHQMGNFGGLWHWCCRAKIYSWHFPLHFFSPVEDWNEHKLDVWTNNDSMDRKRGG